MPVELMGTVEQLIHHHKMRLAGLTSGSPLAQLRAARAQGDASGEAGAAKASTKVGLQRGRVHTVADTYGFIRPEDVTGDKDMYFRLSDAVDDVRIGDEVTFDTVRDERGMSQKDMRAVNIQLKEVEPYAGYDDLDTMPWQESNAALLWCTESLQRGPGSTGGASAQGSTAKPRKRAGGRRRASGGSAAASTSGFVMHTDGDDVEGGVPGDGHSPGGGKGGRRRKGRGRKRGTARPQRLDISPVDTNSRKRGTGTLPAAGPPGRRGKGTRSSKAPNGGAASPGRPTTPGGSVLPRLSSRDSNPGAVASDGEPQWRSAADSKGRPPRRRVVKRRGPGHVPSGAGDAELAPILRRGQMLLK